MAMIGINRGNDPGMALDQTGAIGNLIRLTPRGPRSFRRNMGDADMSVFTQSGGSSPMFSRLLPPGPDWGQNYRAGMGGLGDPGGDGSLFTDEAADGRSPMYNGLLPNGPDYSPLHARKFRRSLGDMVYDPTSNTTTDTSTGAVTIGNQTSSITGVLSNPALLTGINAEAGFAVNLARSIMGLPALPASATAPSVNVGLSGTTLLAIGAALLFFLKR